ncbi:hypothetical protein LTR35_010375 [Friedmanniomyces endolithicus]|uniref:Uncharacterized protein n=1 Tax=Friedmanniomyces endolithicus TaxID=329885 RepID=A0AAN6FYX7_9PEZI|nr:hypothetical protein LTR35_010375 [Friedmanniomyces endolithicus]KAK0294251.1 hypothetical protein LTS00_007226 [Friedmanniomyces endolithicus]KAK0325472.1 hypothetical protein LTR82_003755 [Friedmanniomyces endolithicus]KAK1003286.1 hypothetical protein LTR54_007799 [Friedmanniomyces endolithicus]
MGSVHVHPPGGKSFPVNAKQLHYLVEREYMEYPAIEKRDIEAQGKVDVLARIITAMQALNFLVTIIARFATRLEVTTLELTVLANICCTLVTTLVWWHKPTDVETSQTFPLHTTIETIIKDAAVDSKETYRETPLDFLSHDEWSGSLLWNYYVNILRRLKVLEIFRLQYDKPAQRMSSFNFPLPGSRPHLLFLLCFTMAYCAFFLLAWNSHFPTTTERTLWRAVVVAQSVAGFIAGGFEIAMFNTPVKHSPSTPQQAPKAGVRTNPKRGQAAISSLHTLWDMPCNNELSGRFPDLDVPFRSILITTPCCAVYVVCRWYILTEDIVMLRSLPASAFRQVPWTPYWPWF